MFKGLFSPKTLMLISKDNSTPAWASWGIYTIFLFVQGNPPVPYVWSRGKHILRTQPQHISDTIKSACRVVWEVGVGIKVSVRLHPEPSSPEFTLQLLPLPLLCLRQTKRPRQCPVDRLDFQIIGGMKARFLPLLGLRRRSPPLVFASFMHTL